jgi:hypothetical protein
VLISGKFPSFISSVEALSPSYPVNTYYASAEKTGGKQPQTTDVFILSGGSLNQSRFENNCVFFFSFNCSFIEVLRGYSAPYSATSI